MNRDDLGARLRATFAQELVERASEMSTALLALEQRANDPEVVRVLFRAAHTIKGGARLAGEPALERFCHELESVFAQVRDERKALDGAALSLLFAVVDALAEKGRLMQAGDPGGDDAIASLEPRLIAMAAGGRPVARRLDAPSPPAPVAPDAPEPGPARDPRHADVVRVRAGRLDDLLAAVGELAMTSRRAAERLGRRDEDARRLERAADEVRQVTQGLRMRPFGDVCEGLPRAVRDLARAEGKEVELLLAGQTVEADRMVMDALREPLLHLVRNAVDHGIETPGMRRRAGKPETGRITVAAELAGDRLEVTVADDGAGVDEARVRAAARARGRPEPATSAEVARTLLEGGLSTRTETTEISGRGVGLDLVSAALGAIGGTVGVDWWTGAGTTFTLECPPSPASLRAVLARVGAHVVAIPATSVERVRRITPDQSLRAGGRPMVEADGGPLAVHALGALLGPPFDPGRSGGGVALVIAAGARRAALLVDEVLGEEQIVSRPIRSYGRPLGPIAAASVLPGRAVALVLNPTALLAVGARDGGATWTPPVELPTRRRVLVADDSITTRTLEQSVLEAAGYRVALAFDGMNAWEQLERDGADVLVADVEMPRMDGFALCRRIRASAALARLPIVLVTGLASDADRARGLEAGADAYLVKSSFDQAGLLETLHQLIGDQ